MDYIKKPVIVQAEQWYPGFTIAGVKCDQEKCFMYTLEGKMTVRPEDWIVTGVLGEKYPCRDDIFS